MCMDEEHSHSPRQTRKSYQGRGTRRYVWDQLMALLEDGVASPDRMQGSTVPDYLREFMTNIILDEISPGVHCLVLATCVDIACAYHGNVRPSINIRPRVEAKPYPIYSMRAAMVLSSRSVVNGLHTIAPHLNDARNSQL